MGFYYHFSGSLEKGGLPVDSRVEFGILDVFKATDHS
jgi:hypothetical protein